MNWNKLWKHSKKTLLRIKKKNKKKRVNITKFACRCKNNWKLCKKKLSFKFQDKKIKEMEDLLSECEVAIDKKEIYH